jgi:uroporphyrinogen decarboxylase
LSLGTDFRFIRALKRQEVDRTPVWIMRQAGRYMAEYRALRAQANDFLAFCKNPQLCMQAAMLPIDKYDLDAAIVFSDILVVPHAMGMDLAFVEHEGPIFTQPLRTLEDLAHLTTLNSAVSLDYVLEAIHLTKKHLAQRKPLIGFVGSPWTLAAYMVEGSGSKQFSQVRRMLYTNPVILHRLLELLALNLIDFIKQQIKAGVDAIQIFDSWAGLLSKEAYNEFSLQYLKKIVLSIKSQYPHIPIIIFAKNGGMWIDDLIQTQCDALSLDWQADIYRIKEQFGAQIALQGNLDPCVLYAEPKIIAAQTHKLLELFHGHQGFVFNLGHGIYPDVPADNLAYMLKIIREYATS